MLFASPGGRAGSAADGPSGRRKNSRAASEERAGHDHVERPVPGAEDRQADVDQLGCVAMRAPHNQPRHTRRTRFEHQQVADASLVGTALVVDDQHITLSGVAERLEKRLRAPGVVPGGQHSPRQPVPRHHRADPRRSCPQRHADTDAGIREERRGQFLERGQHAAPGTRANGCLCRPRRSQPAAWSAPPWEQLIDALRLTMCPPSRYRAGTAVALGAAPVFTATPEILSL